VRRSGDRELVTESGTAGAGILASNMAIATSRPQFIVFGLRV